MGGGEIRVAVPARYLYLRNRRVKDVGLNSSNNSKSIFPVKKALVYDVSGIW
jgi:hypothetical protein